MTATKQRPYTRDDVLYARRCRGETHTYSFDHNIMRLTDDPEYCGPIGKVHEYRTELEYDCKAGSWFVQKVDVDEGTKPIEYSTMRLTARRMCNRILGEPEPPEGLMLTPGDIAAEFGEVRMSYRTHESSPCVMVFAKGSLLVSVAGLKWPQAHARLFHRIVQEKRRRELVQQGRL